MVFPVLVMEHPVEWQGTAQYPATLETLDEGKPAESTATAPMLKGARRGS
jgi:hypothetical protein